MKLSACLLATSLLVLVACTPKSEPELDGAPGETPAPSGPSAPEPAPDLAGGEPADGIILPGVIGILQPGGSFVQAGCEHTIAPDYDKPPAMTCLYMLASGAGTAQADPTDPAMLTALGAAGWQSVRNGTSERYFERPKAGTDCADVMALIALDAKQTAALIASAKAEKAPAGQSWRAYAIPASTREACGADRMKP
jgi:hypothetical protein